jgi:hypothetical protein
MSEVLLGKDVFSVLHYSKAHFDAYKVIRLIAYNTVCDECVSE